VNERRFLILRERKFTAPTTFALINSSLEPFPINHFINEVHEELVCIVLPTTLESGSIAAELAKRWKRVD
jgi:hypothetical protein